MLFSDYEPGTLDIIDLKQCLEVTKSLRMSDSMKVIKTWANGWATSRRLHEAIGRKSRVKQPWIDEASAAVGAGGQIFIHLGHAVADQEDGARGEHAMKRVRRGWCRPSRAAKVLHRARSILILDFSIAVS